MSWLYVALLTFAIVKIKPYRILKIHTLLIKMSLLDSDYRMVSEKKTCSFCTWKTIVLSNLSVFLHHHHFLRLSILLAHSIYTHMLNLYILLLPFIRVYCYVFCMHMHNVSNFSQPFLCAYIHYSINAHTVIVYRLLFVCFERNRFKQFSRFTCSPNTPE